jgi:hypothetical protein
MAPRRPRRSRPVLEAYWRLLREGLTPEAAGNLAALEATDYDLAPAADGWTPAQTATLLFLKATRTRWR